MRRADRPGLQKYGYMFLKTQMIDRPYPLHQIEQLIVASQKNVQPHFNMVSFRIYPTPHLAIRKFVLGQSPVVVHFSRAIPQIVVDPGIFAPVESQSLPAPWQPNDRVKSLLPLQNQGFLKIP